LQLHENLSTLGSAAIAGASKPYKAIDRRDERKFPVEVLRRAAVQSVTGVTNSPANFMFFIIKHCFLGRFSHGRLAVDGLR
jgi:hypothetical protein